MNYLSIMKKTATFLAIGATVLGALAADRADDGRGLIEAYASNNNFLSDVSPFRWYAGAITGGSSGGAANHAIDRSNSNTWAPESIYQLERWGVHTITFTGLVPGATYLAELHLTENYFGGSSSGRGGVAHLQRRRERRHQGVKPRRLQRGRRSLARALPPVRGDGGRERNGCHPPEQRQGQRAHVRRGALRLRRAVHAGLVRGERPGRHGGHRAHVESLHGRPPLLPPAWRKRERPVDGCRGIVSRNVRHPYPRGRVRRDAALPLPSRRLQRRGNGRLLRRLVPAAVRGQFAQDARQHGGRRRVGHLPHRRPRAGQ